ncbi:MAG: hypothetical protein ACOYJB_09845 [Christensenellaceae bacterium]|jgi:hypothetical protein
MELHPMIADELEATVRQLLDSGERSVIVTLLRGDVLFGDLRYLPRFFDGTAEEAEQEGLWMPERARAQGPDFRWALRLLPLDLTFNSEAGTIAGQSYTVLVPAEVVADVRPIPWARALLGSDGFHNAPNPIASAVAAHNTDVAQRYGVQPSALFEFSLPTEDLPPDGIEFSNDELVYRDLDHFAHAAQLGVSFGAGVAGLSRQPAIRELIHSKLSDGVVERVGRFVREKVGVQSGVSELRIVGRIEVPEDELTTQLEGEACIVVYCCDEESAATRLPVILKRNSLSYPPELLSLVASPLVFYGERKQIPIGNQSWVLLARAIGYIADENNTW